MGKLPSTILRRPSLATGCLPSTASLALPHHTPTSAATVNQSSSQHAAAGQVRHATFVPRSRRPYQFTQLVQLSDGSTFTMRTTSPLALYKSAKDSRNHVLWQPTEKSLRNVEVDEAGKLAAFRERYGTSWDLETPTAESAEAPSASGKQEGSKADAAAASKEGKEKGEKKEVEAKAPTQEAAPADPFDSLVDLISAYASEDKNIKGGLSAKDQARKDKSGKKK
ncbi:hypothetical protein C7999DRAFT_12388 [Corynascus novoguineensis]|uniref:Ribosomal protein bL31m N-terminal domain-containing protein n=1 Tax=Corynascus novoguineensis TaxID=1126955 RepID=A0AAN7HRY4_9PEZI|nr:hypothetical protein C7999DRAFT_12388 [Corynascus novoguineensis]